MLVPRDMKIPWDSGLFWWEGIKTVEYMKFYEIVFFCVEKVKRVWVFEDTSMARVFLKVCEGSHI